MEQRIREEKANLVIVDSLARLCPGADEDRSKDMVPIIAGLARIARATNAGILVIHHRGKGESGYRGSSGIRDQCDMLFVLDRDTEDKRIRTIRPEKFRLDIEPPTRAFALNAVGGHVTLDGSEAPGPKTKPTMSGELRVRITAAIDGEMSTSEIAAAVGVDSQSGTFKRALAGAVKAGAIRGTKFAHYAPAGSRPEGQPLGDWPSGLLHDEAPANAIYGHGEER